MDGEVVLWEVYWLAVLIAFLQEGILAVSNRFGPWTWEQECFRCGEGDYIDGAIPVEQICDANGGTSNQKSAYPYLLFK